MIDNKRAQSWYIDFILGALIFTGAFFLMLKYMPSSNNSLFDATLDAEILSDVMISEGLPKNWTEDTNNIIKLGLTTGGKIDGDKWSNLSSLNYKKAKDLIPVSADFLIYLTYVNGTKIQVNNGPIFIGKDGMNESVTDENIVELFDPDSIVSLDRYVAYEGKIVIMNVIVWI
jgi:hypothetical protein